MSRIAALDFHGNLMSNRRNSQLVAITTKGGMARPGTLERGVSRRKFRIFLIKPSHYDRDGYVIQWWRSTIPSNSLASVYGLLAECAEDQVLGPDVDIEIDSFDECNKIGRAHV